MIRMFVLLLSLAIAGNARADMFLTLDATRSTQLSGLLDYLLPIFKAASNLSVHVVTLDAGQAVAVAERGDADALLLNDRRVEDQLLADGHGVNLRDAMYDDFVIVGPRSDPAGIRGVPYASKALAQIAAKRALFASPGDDSGAHQMELRLWKSADIQPNTKSAWYRVAGQSMETTLSLAAATNAYTLADRASWAGFRNRQNLEVLVERDPLLFNVYGSMLISPAKWPQVKITFARIWHDWLTDKHGFAAITSYQINGEQIFFPCQGLDVGLCRSVSAR
ncbi:MAG TPA: substrate-binding domain-containing protein [Acetobacteraceae bacterium]|nr:substrate-binding domain-containing protein [Acetobacteraceae bacterium]